MAIAHKGYNHNYMDCNNIINFPEELQRKLALSKSCNLSGIE
jgi:hypothetical protein